MKEINAGDLKEVNVDTFANNLQAEKCKLLNVLSTLDPTNEDYHSVLCRIEDIHKMQLEDIHEEHEVLKINAAKEINPNTLIATGGSIGAILLIMNYERLHALTSKGVNVATRMIPHLM